MFVRTPREPWWSLSERPGWWRLRARPESLSDTANPSFVCRRLQSRDFTAYTALDFTPSSDDDTAGLALVHSPDFQIRLEIFGARQRAARVVRRLAGADEIIASTPVGGGLLRLGVEGHGAATEFRLADAAGWRVVARCDASHLSYRSAGGFFGVVVGMFASGGESGSTTADFDWFELSSLDAAEGVGGAGAAYPYRTDPAREFS
jgi:alpha-N-arabinofuranosidase